MTMRQIEQNADPRSRIRAAAGGLLARGGLAAATTRAIADAAGVQAPTIYRLFGDKHALLTEVATQELADYIEAKAVRAPCSDPVEELRNGWDAHVAFGLENPALIAVLHGGGGSPVQAALAAAGLDVLRQKMRVVALAGRLRVSETRAVDLFHAICAGTIQTLLGRSDEDRDDGLARAAREAAIAAITVEPAPPAASATAAAALLAASLALLPVLSDGERHLMAELLERIANGRSVQPES